MGKHSLRKKRPNVLPRLAGIGAMVGASTLGSVQVGHAAPDSVWDRLAQCESSGNWHINTGNGYYGGLQFLPSTWRAFGGSGMPHQASRAEQIRVAERTLAVQGWNAWPACSRKLGLQGYRAEPDRRAAANVQSKKAPQASPASGRTHVVRSGDTLSEIAPHNWYQVAKRNGIKNPDRIYVGQVIKL